VIEGAATKMGRTLHGIAYNPVRDEIIVGNPLAAVVLVFRGGANGNEAPLRTLQGPKTKLAYPHSVAIDVHNKELIVLDRGAQSVLFFPWDAEGDVAPLRILHGEKTMLERVVGAAVDPERDLLVVTSTTSARKQPALYIFNRTDNGNVAPRAIIAGPKTGIQSSAWQLEVHQGKVFAAIVNDFYRPLYSNNKLRPGVGPDTAITSPWRSERVGFIGVWKTTDNGDVPPLAIIRGPGSSLIHPGGIAINPKNKEIFAVDSVRNGLFTFLVPEFFGETSGK
jgi:DNA-binding beta-propeller fold protein YncE